ncbi:MAG: CRTAC1 family protein [Planctomycetota bacterium]|jgi:hypothetical protein
MRRGYLGGLGGFAAVLACSAGDPIAPFTEEAVVRGLVYQMQPYPQAFGLDGFGCGFADLDGDGDPDVILLGALDGQVGIFENIHDTGLFFDHSASSQIPALLGASGFCSGDYDGDGDADLYITQTGADEGMPTYLLRNDGDFKFADVTADAGVVDEGAGTGASFGDFDGDGWLDLYVCNYNGAVPGTNDIDNKLYRNRGDGTFEKVGVEQGVDDPGYGFQSVFFDFDRDGDPDLYLSNDRGHLPPLFAANRLWRNDDGQFTDVSESSGAGVALFSMGAACGDFDGNRWPDLYVTNLAGYEDGYNPLLLGQGDGTFVEASATAGVDHWITSWGSIFADFDNDGRQDLYVNNMFVDNSLYLNIGGFPCAEEGAAAGVTGNSGISFGSAVADVDGDGDIDLLVNNLGANVELFINHEGETRNWIRYRMVGQGNNPEAIGGNADTRSGSTWRYAEIIAGGNGYLGQNELTLHVGLGDDTTVDEVVASWPGGQTVRTLNNLPINETWTLYPPERLGDADGDLVVDLDDYFALAACYAGGFAPGCEMMDFDGSSAIDQIDAEAFLKVYEGDVHDCDGSGVADLLEILLDPDLDQDGTAIPDSCEASGDLDGDGQVSTIDLLILLGEWGPCGAPCPADMDGSGAVGTGDLLILLGNWD